MQDFKALRKTLWTKKDAPTILQLNVNDELSPAKKRWPQLAIQTS
jgi:hypothetical protein